jgi:HD-GYP domain-containing protein (c-di-GMP phosphodiesterase class II)
VKGLIRRQTGIEGEAAISLFRRFDAAGTEQEYLPVGWEEARRVTAILLDAATPKDGYTAEHAVEVARLSRLVGIDLGFNKEELEVLVQGALLHDLGKLGVADAILRKPDDVLTEEEWAAVKRHPEIGAQMIEPIVPLSGTVPVVKHHHERPDGTGYPDRLKGEQIPLAARTVAVADAYDVMLRGRPYRPKRSPAEALEELSREAGSQFDVRVVEAFGRLLGDAKGHTSL